MGDETWASIQMVKNKREIFREKLKRRRAERDTILSAASGGSNSNSPGPSTSSASLVAPLAGMLKYFQLLSFSAIFIKKKWVITCR